MNADAINPVFSK